MGSKRDLLKSYSCVISSHRQWLSSFGKNHQQKWSRLFNNNPEAAICEACTRQFLRDNRIEVCPNDIGSRAPDFKCSRAGKDFYVEVTCITMDKVSSKSGLQNTPKGSSYYHMLTDVFLRELSRKSSQCSMLTKPCLVAVGTLHGQGGVRCFGKLAVKDLLSGTTKVTMKYDGRLGQGVGLPYLSTALQDSAFIRFKKDHSGKIEFARNPISGVLLCSFGYRKPRVFGALHPNPNRPFDRTMLPDTPFCALKDDCESDRLIVEWI